MNRMHLTKAQRNAREAAEASLRPLAKLPVKPPAWLKGHAEASKAWTRLIALYSETKEEIVTAFDAELLATYALLIEEIFVTLPALQKSLQGLANNHKKRIPLIQDESARAKLQEALNGLLKQILGIDSRIDRKRKLALDRQSSLYLSPRSRAGVPPTEKEKPAPLTDMEKLLEG